MIVAYFRGGIPLWLPDWLVEWILARDERRAKAEASELRRRYPMIPPAPRRVVCPSCGVPFTRHGARRSFDRCARTGDVLEGRTRENDVCIVCREGLDPVTLEPLAGGRTP